MVVAVDNAHQLAYITFKGNIQNLTISHKINHWGFDSHNASKNYGNPFTYLSINHLFCIKNYVFWDKKLVYQFRKMPYGSSNIVNMIKLKDRWVITSTTQVVEISLDGKFMNEYVDEPLYRQGLEQVTSFKRAEIEELRQSAYFKLIIPILIKQINDFLIQFINSIEMNLHPNYTDFYLNTLLNYVCRDTLTKLTKDTHVFESILTFELNTGTSGNINSSTTSYSLGLVVNAMTQYDGATEITLFWKDSIKFR